MKKLELIDKLATETKLSRYKATKVVNSLINLIRKNLKAGNTVNLSGLGNFRVRTSKARKGRNPKTGESIDIPETKRISFKASAGLKKTLKS